MGTYLLDTQHSQPYWLSIPYIKNHVFGAMYNKVSTQGLGTSLGLHLKTRLNQAPVGPAVHLHRFYGPVVGGVGQGREGDRPSANG